MWNKINGVNFKSLAGNIQKRGMEFANEVAKQVPFEPLQPYFALLYVRYKCYFTASLRSCKFVLLHVKSSFICFFNSFSPNELCFF